MLLGAPVSLVVRCAQCRKEVLEADVMGDEEECLLRDHLLAVHPTTIQPETRGVLLRHFVVTQPKSRTTTAFRVSWEGNVGARSEMTRV